MYCSNECRQAAADQYHRALCLGSSQEDPNHPVNKLKDAWRSMHYPPETSSIMLMARMVATVKQINRASQCLEKHLTCPRQRALAEVVLSILQPCGQRGGGDCT
ncbi:unnamed protein product [Coregonus sp. 'balchen']|nr:unnamed protein product [Coregonus sp. 'balchen']